MNRVKVKRSRMDRSKLFHLRVVCFKNKLANDEIRNQITLTFVAPNEKILFLAAIHPLTAHFIIYSYQVSFVVHFLFSFSRTFCSRLFLSSHICHCFSNNSSLAVNTCLSWFWPCVMTQRRGKEVRMFNGSEVVSLLCSSSPDTCSNSSCRDLL